MGSLMSDNRPAELISHIEATSEKNDSLILEALGKLESPKARGKLKVTVASICALTGLSRNTVRNRQWALDRIKDIKKKVKSDLSESSQGGSGAQDEVTILDGLRGRVKKLLGQNSLLYEEILSLHRLIERKDAEITELKGRKFQRV